MWKVVFSKQAAKDAKRLIASGLGAKAKALIELVKKDPFATPPSYKALVGSLSGLYSRRINLQHRFVYEIIPTPLSDKNTTSEGTVKVLRMWSGYDGL